MAETKQELIGAETLNRLQERIFDEVTAELVLNEVGHVWYLESGSADVFLVELENGRVVSSYKHVSRVTAGRLVFCVDHETDTGLQLRLKGFPGFRIYKIRLADLAGRLCPDALARQMDWWLEDLTTAIVRDIPVAPRFDLVVAAGSRCGIEAGPAVSSQRGIVWVTTGGAAAYLGTGDTGPEAPQLLALGMASWAVYVETMEVEAFSTAHLVEQGTIYDALDRFHAVAIAGEKLNRQIAQVDVANIQVDSSRLRDAAEDDARRKLAHIAYPGRNSMPDNDSLLLKTLKIIGQREGIEFAELDHDGSPSLESILAVSSVRAREVDLASEPKWWTGDSFALLGFRATDNQPVALLPGGFGSYRMIDPDTRAAIRLNKSEVRAICPKAWMFYRPLPARAVALRDVLRMARKGLGSESMRFVAGGIAVGLVSFLPAFIIGLFTDWVLPAQSPELLWTLTLGLIVAAVTGMLLTFMQGSTLLRVEARIATRLTAALWDRILGIRPNSLKGFSAGELTARAMVFQSLRERASNVVTSSVVSVLFLFPTLSLLFLFDTLLAITSLVLAVAAMTVVIVLGLMQFRPQKQYLEERQTLSGTLFQFINGIEKLRSAGAEQSAFAFWAQGFVRSKEAEISVNRLNEIVVAITSSIPLVSATVLFAVTLVTRSESISLGDFFIIYATSMMFFAAATRLGSSIQTLATIVPDYQQVQPLLDCVPETPKLLDPEDNACFELRGELRFDHVTFRYSGDEEPVLDDVSIHVSPGEFVAIVGESGAGKTTLLNLALGLEHPTSGTVYYDSRNVSKINRRWLRRQLGVVSQNGSLQPGTVLKNITGISRDLSQKDAWNAARMAAVDQDIRKMHMEMSTPVGDSATTFSGGQIQRILIAAAIVRKPRIVFLDEATNWLDNKSQAEVMKSIASLAATRIVIAHRLSTIRQADRIFVLEKGRLAQSGTFDELSTRPGLFKRLISRQLLEENESTGEQK